MNAVYHITVSAHHVILDMIENTLAVSVPTVPLQNNVRYKKPNDRKTQIWVFKAQ